jgi:hypothetical protein
MLPAILSDTFNLEQRKNSIRNMYPATRSPHGDREAQDTRMQSVIGYYGIIEQIGVLQDEVRSLRAGLREGRQ